MATTPLPFPPHPAPDPLPDPRLPGPPADPVPPGPSPLLPNGVSPRVRPRRAVRDPPSSRRDSRTDNPGGPRLCRCAPAARARHGSLEGGDLWQRAALIAFAGFVAGVFYQLGGIRRPGVRLNLPMLLGAFLPWTLLTLAICAQRAAHRSGSATCARHPCPGARSRAGRCRSRSWPSWTASLLAFALVEPRSEIAST